MANTAEIKAVITAEDKASATLKKFGDNINSANDSINNISSTSKEAESSFARLTKAFIFGNVLYSVGANSVVKFKTEISDLITQANEAAKIQQQLNAVIASTGGVAGVTAKAANDLADSIRNNTTLDNDQILVAENMLLTFRDVGKNVFPDATKAIVDMSTAMNGGLTPNSDKLRQTALQVGKALQDPILGVTTLRRVGVQLSDQQQQQVKNFIAVNDKASAQRVILDELSKEFGGSAARTADTFSGKMQQLKNRFDDFGKSIVLNIEGSLNRNLPKMENFASQVLAIAQKVGNFLLPSFEALWNTISLKVFPVLTKLWHEVLEPLLPIIGVVLVGSIKLAIDALNIFLSVVSPVMDYILNHKWIVEALAVLFTILAANMAFGAIAAGFNGAMNSVTVTMNIMRLITIPATIGSLQALAAGFAIPAAAAIAASILIINAANAAKAAWDNAAAAAVNKGNSDLSVIAQLKNTIATGNTDQQSRARQVLNRYQTTGQFASGTDYAPGGMALVGERGPELVNLPRGSQVIPNNKLSKQSWAAPINITFSGIFTGSEQEFRKLAIKVFQSASDAASMQNKDIASMTTQNWRRV